MQEKIRHEIDFVGKLLFLKRRVEYGITLGMISRYCKRYHCSLLLGAAVNSFDLEADKFPIIERVLEHGGDRQVEFVLAYSKHEDIICVVQQSSYLSPMTVNYWCLFLT